MPPKPPHMYLGRRERQIMEAIHRLGEASVKDVLDQLHDSPSYSTVRTIMRLLEEKGHLKHRRDGMKYVYRPTVTLDKARRSALEHLLVTFFGGSVSDAFAAALDLSREKLTDAELDQLSNLIDEARKDGR